jgi:hypothetical protein
LLFGFVAGGRGLDFFMHLEILFVFLLFELLVDIDFFLELLLFLGWGYCLLLFHFGLFLFNLVLFLLEIGRVGCE